MSGLGQFPLGGFPASIEASVGDPLPGLLADTSARREFLLRATPLDANGDPVNVDYSTGAYFSKPTDTPYKLFPEAIENPYNFQASLERTLMGGCSLGISSLPISNPDGVRDSDAVLDWLGASADIYIGRPTDALPAFTRIFRGVTAGVSRDLSRYRLLHRDVRFRLQRRLHQHRYKGFGPALRGNGTSSTCGTASAIIPGGAITIECMYRHIAYSVGYNAQLLNNLSTATAGSRRIVWTANGSGEIGVPRMVVVNDVAASFTWSGAAASDYPLGRWFHLALVLDVPNLQMIPYIDGVPQTPVTLTGTFATAYSGLNLLSTTGPSLYANGDIDEVRIWNRARTEQEILRDKDRQLTGTESGLLHYWKADEASGTTLADSVSGGVSLTATSCTWVGSLEGDVSLTGKVKPLTFGKKRQVKATCVDPQNLIFQIHDGSVHAINAVKIGGDPLTFGANRTDPYDGVPSTNYYDTVTSRGLFRLGTDPASAEVTADVEGAADGTLGYQETASGIHRKIATEYGGLVEVDSLDLAAYSRLALTQPAVVGHFFGEEINIDEALALVSKGICSWWSPTRVAKLTVGRVENPDDADASVNLDEGRIVNPDEGGTWSDEPVNVRIGEVIVAYREYPAVLDAASVAEGVDLATRVDLAQRFRYVRAYDFDRADDADVLQVETSFDDAADAQAEADRLLALWKVQRRAYNLRLDFGLLSYFIGTVFSVTYPRYNLTNGKNVVCIGITENIGEHGAADSLEVSLLG